MAIPNEDSENSEKSRKRDFAKLLYENDVMKPCFSYFPLSLALLFWLPIVGLPLLDVPTDFYLIGTFKIYIYLTRRRPNVQGVRGEGGVKYLDVPTIPCRAQILSFCQLLAK